MDENKNLWNKTAAEVTVKDQLIVAAVAPIVTIGAMALGAAALGVAKSTLSKFRKDKTTVETNQD